MRVGEMQVNFNVTGILVLYDTGSGEITAEGGSIENMEPKHNRGKHG